MTISRISLLLSALLTACVYLILRFIYETEHFNGVAELLEILGRFVSTITQTHIELILLLWRKAHFVVYHGHTHTHTHTYIYCTWPAAPIHETAGNPVN